MPSAPKRLRSKDRHAFHKLLRVSPTLYARLARLAGKTGRNVTEEARLGLEQYVGKQEAALKLNPLAEDDVDELSGRPRAIQ